MHPSTADPQLRQHPCHRKPPLLTVGSDAAAGPRGFLRPRVGEGLPSGGGAVPVGHCSGGGGLPPGMYDTARSLNPDTRSLGRARRLASRRGSHAGARPALAPYHPLRLSRVLLPPLTADRCGVRVGSYAHPDGKSLSWRGAATDASHKTRRRRSCAPPSWECLRAVGPDSSAMWHHLPRHLGDSHNRGASWSPPEANPQFEQSRMHHHGRDPKQGGPRRSGWQGASQRTFLAIPFWAFLVRDFRRVIPGVSSDGIQLSMEEGFLIRQKLCFRDLERHGSPFCSGNAGMDNSADPEGKALFEMPSKIRVSKPKLVIMRPELVSTRPYS